MKERMLNKQRGRVWLGKKVILEQKNHKLEDDQFFSTGTDQFDVTNYRD
jgi:hypothetical protein